jgi:hypothetical protein
MNTVHYQMIPFSVGCDKKWYHWFFIVNELKLFKWPWVRFETKFCWIDAEIINKLALLCKKLMIQKRQSKVLSNWGFAGNSPRTVHRGTIHCAQFTAVTIHRQHNSLRNNSPRHNSPCTIHCAKFTTHNSSRRNLPRKNKNSARWILDSDDS